MSVLVSVADAEDEAVLDMLDEFAAERFTEAMRCRPSAARLLPLYPERWRLPRLASGFHLLYAYDGVTPTAENLLGYCVIDPNTGLIRWLICVYETVTAATVLFCEEARSAWGLTLHGHVENQLVVLALLEDTNIIRDGDEIVYVG